MVNAVFTQNPTSIYDDQPGIAYHFPKRYLKAVQATIGDWVVFYENRQGAFGYVAVQKVRSVVPDPQKEDHYYAYLEPETLWQFETVVTRNDPAGMAYEESLRGPDGRAQSGGASVSAVRTMSFDAFSQIVMHGLQSIDGPLALPREESQEMKASLNGFAESPALFESAAPLQDLREELLVSRPARDASFARQVKAAYNGRCAISGLDLRNGGGRAEVQAAHIRPVQDNGPDIVQNGLALSGTVHWMFDRGLIAISDNFEILVSDNKVPKDVQARLIAPNRKLTLPQNPRFYPHKSYLAFHREKYFGRAA